VISSSTFELIESVKDSKVLFVGDDIIDEYQYVSPLGKASKENIIAVKAGELERYHGGTFAAMRHAESFCCVDIYCHGPVTVKRRFVDEAYNRKLFEVHSEEFGFCYKPPNMESFDAVVVTDFGHGCVDDVDRRFEDAKFLAVCAQSNAANYGYNLITKYDKADYVVIDEPEARLAAQDRTSPIEDVILKLAPGHFKTMIVTHGKHGATGWNGKFAHCPAFTEKVVDTMGAGDAFFAVTAPMAKTGSLEDLLLIGNAAGAIKTGIVGHRESVTKEHLLAFLKQ